MQDVVLRTLRRDGGSAAVEFALVFPIAIVFLCGALAYGLYFGAAHAVQQLAADAARASVAGLSDAERTAIATAHVATNGGTYLLLRPERLSVVAQPLAADSNQFQVKVSFNSSELPIWAFQGLLPLPDRTIARSATIRRGGY